MVFCLFFVIRRLIGVTVNSVQMPHLLIDCGDSSTNDSHPMPSSSSSLVFSSSSSSSSSFSSSSSSSSIKQISPEKLRWDDGHRRFPCLNFKKPEEKAAIQPKPSRLFTCGSSSDSFGKNNEKKKS